MEQFSQSTCWTPAEDLRHLKEQERCPRIQVGWKKGKQQRTVSGTGLAPLVGEWWRGESSHTWGSPLTAGEISCKMLINKIKDDINRWKHMFLGWKNQCCQKLQYCPRQLTDLMQYLSMAFSTELKEKKNLICMETEKTPNSQGNLENQKQSWSN